MTKKLKMLTTKKVNDYLHVSVIVCNHNRLLRLSLFVLVSLCRRFGLSGGILFICLHRLHGVTVSAAMENTFCKKCFHSFVRRVNSSFEGLQKGDIRPLEGIFQTVFKLYKTIRGFSYHLRNYHSYPSMNKFFLQSPF